MTLKKISDLKILNKKVILRADYNVPIKNGKVNQHNTWRIDATLKTINYLIQKNAQIILLCHLGRPQGKVDDKLSVKPIAQYLAKKLKRRLIILNNQSSYFNPELKNITYRLYIISRKNIKSLSELNQKDILMLENIRFHKGEKTDSKKFAQELAALGDVFINEAFATCHRAHVSTYFLAKLLPAAAGFLLQKEITTLENLLKNTPQHPLVFVMGGAKAKTKTSLIKKFLPQVDDILVGGVLANTILSAQGIAIGKSIVDKETAQSLKQLEITNTKLHLPVDVLVSSGITGKQKISIRPIGNIGKENMILDIGPDTILLFKSIIEKAKTIIWNGPMGYTETVQFSHGTEEILKAIIENSSAYTLAGGGESISQLNKHNSFNKINFVSTGGGAMLQLLAGKKLPCIKVLESN
jgi:phosphoglycerate kinase